MPPYARIAELVGESARNKAFVQVGSNGSKNTYHRFSEAGGMEDHVEAGAAAQRSAFIQGLAPARMP